MRDDLLKILLVPLSTLLLMLIVNSCGFREDELDRYDDMCDRQPDSIVCNGYTLKYNRIIEAKDIYYIQMDNINRKVMIE